MPSRWPMDDEKALRCPSGLYVVATPIGNLADITLRAVQTLQGVDLIAAEDTRHTLRLLFHYRIRTPLISCHEHNEHQRTPELIEKIQAGASVALVADAGTPSLSDPGYRLVRAAVEAGLDLFPIPGVSAAITALCVSGLPTDAFVFVGFLPRKAGKRLELLTGLAAEPRTLVFYESPRRVRGLLQAIRTLIGDRPAVLAREMTKLHEEFIRGPLSAIETRLAERAEIKGECTLLVAGRAAPDAVAAGDLEAALVEALARPGAHLSHLTQALARQYGLPRKTVYALALDIQKSGRTL